MSGDDTRSIRDLREGSSGASAPVDSDHVVGERIGRYLILSRIRAGGMGIVYAAYDPELDRRIALKLLLRRTAGSEANQDLLRGEARALARLQHQNVVSVYDVGEHRGRVFIAMELVEGQTLSEWLAAEKRSWREIVEVFLRAGRGLAAAHGEKLLHGDFKPSNVMIGDDGSVRVTDFGLARVLGRAASVPGSDGEEAAGPKGTPGFIAPEILGGEAGDARSDLFSFCVALSQILFGSKEVTGSSGPPHPGKDFQGVQSRVPGYVRRVLRRGLAEDPDRRCSTMDELLSALSPRRRRRRWVLAAVMSATVLQAALWIPLWQRGGRSEPSCEVRSRFPEKVWGAERAAALERRFVLADPQGGRWMATSVIQALDEYAESWAEVRLDACRGFEGRLESERLYDLRMDCLDQRLSEVEAVADVLLAADPTMVARSLDLVFGIRGLARCGDRAELSNLDLRPFEPTKAAEVDGLRRELESTFLELRTIETVDLESGKKLLERARELGHPLMEARALELVARQLWVRGDMEEARRWTVEALVAAHSVGDRPLQARLYSILAQIESNQGADFNQAELWERLADSVLLPLGEAHNEVRFEIERGLSLVDYEKGDLPRAEARLRRALALGEEIWGPENPRLRTPLSDLAAALGQREAQIKEASRLLRRSLEIGVSTLGPDSPLLLPARVNLSHTLLVLGELNQAESLARDAVRVAEESSTYSRSPFPSLQLAQVLVARDRPGEALGLLDTALMLAEKSYGEAHRVPIEVLYTRGFAELHLLELSKARTTFQQALSLAERLPEDHWCRRPPRLGLGYVELESGRAEVALGLFERLAADESSDDSILAPWMKVMLYGGLGESLLRFERREEAGRYLERAIDEEPSHGDPLLLARPRFALARLLVHQDRVTALALAVAAQAGLSQARSPARHRLHSEVDAWLRIHQGGGR